MPDLSIPYYRIVTFPNPAAGTNFSITAREGEMWRVISLRCRVTFSAAVANRRMQIIADDGSSMFFGACSNSNNVANDVADLCAFTGTEAVSFTSGLMNLALPIEGLPLYPGWRLQSRINNLDAADAITLLAVLVQAYPIGSQRNFIPGLNAFAQG